MALIGTRSGDDVGATAPRNLRSGTTVWSALHSEISESVKCYGPTRERLSQFVSVRSDRVRQRKQGVTHNIELVSRAGIKPIVQSSA
jgi:hypothetical protein